MWTPDGKILYYRDIPGQKLMAVTFDIDEDKPPGKPELLFQGKYMGSSCPWGRNYDIAPNGERFVLIENEEMSSTATQINIIINWSKEVEELLQTFNKNK